MRCCLEDHRYPEALKGHQAALWEDESGNMVLDGGTWEKLGGQDIEIMTSGFGRFRREVRVLPWKGVRQLQPLVYGFGSRPRKLR